MEEYSCEKSKGKKGFKMYEFNLDRWKICCHPLSWVGDKKMEESSS